MEIQQMVLRNLIFKTKVGSSLYGTQTTTSDTDYMGIFIPPPSYIIGLYKCEELELRTNPPSSGRRNTALDTDCTYHSLQKFVRLALANNPGFIEVFFSPLSSAEHHSEWAKTLFSNFSLFISKRVYHTFGGYAASQKHKLETKKDRLDALHNCLAAAQQISREGKNTLAENLHIRGKETCYKTYMVGTQVEYVINNIEKAIQEYGGRTAGIETHGYDLKFASHLIRLLLEAETLLKTGMLSFPLPERQLLSEIKAGKYTLREIHELAEEWEKRVEQAYKHTCLPSCPAFKQINTLQVSLFKQYWQENKENSDGNE